MQEILNFQNKLHDLDDAERDMWILFICNFFNLCLFIFFINNLIKTLVYLVTYFIRD